MRLINSTEHARMKGAEQTLAWRDLQLAASCERADELAHTLNLLVTKTGLSDAYSDGDGDIDLDQLGQDLRAVTVHDAARARLGKLATS